MSPISADGQETLLLLCPAEGLMLPMNPIALTQAQGARRALAARRGCLVVDRHGEVRAIESIEIEGAYGESAARRLLSWLTQGWRIRVELSDPLDMDLDAIRAIVLRSLEAETPLPDAEDARTLDDVTAAVRDATDFAALFQALRLPAPLEALDVL